MKSFLATIWVSTLSVAATCFVHSAPIWSQQEPDCSSLTTVSGFNTPSEKVTTKSRGRALTGSQTNPPSEEQARLNAAIAKIQSWEACAGLESIPVTGLVGQFVKPSDVLVGAKFCVETVKGGPIAQTLPPPGVTFPPPDGITIVTGGGIVLREDLLQGDDELSCVLLAAVLIHESYHLAVPFGPNDRPEVKEAGAWPWTFTYWCTLAGCLTGDQKLILCALYEDTNNGVSGSLCFDIPDCPNPPCPPRVTTKPTWESSSGGSLPPYLQGKSENVRYSDGIGGGSGHFNLNPDTKIAEAVSISAAGLDVIQIDFAAEIPGFQPTAFHPLGSGSVQRVGIAGYNEVSGKGMLVLAQLDFESTPGFSLSTVYDGDGLGIPQDVFSFQQSTSKVFVLDTEGNISLVRTVPGNVEVLATVSDAESLVNSRFIHGYEVVETATGVKSYSIVATDVYSSFYQYSSATNGVVVECFDTDLDGDFDEIRERLSD